MFQDIGKTEHFALVGRADVRLRRVPVAVVDGGERHGREVGRGARVRARGAPAVRHLHEPAHQRPARPVHAQSAADKDKLNYVLSKILH